MKRSNRRGFSLLEVLVATVVMAIAVTGLLSNLASSFSNVSKLTEYDRAALLARRKMDEMLVERRLPFGVPLEGVFPPQQSGGAEAGWRAQIMPVEWAQGTGPGRGVLERIGLEVWWKSGRQLKSIRLESFRRRVVTDMDMAAVEAAVQVGGGL